MKYFVCVLFLAGAAVAQWGQDDGQWRDDSAQWNSGPYSGQWDGDQGGQWNPAADGSLAGQYNPAVNNWVAPPVPAPWAPANPWAAPGVPQDTPEVAAAKAAHLAAHAATAQRWKRSALYAATPLVTPLVHSVWGARSIVAPIATHTVW